MKTTDTEERALVEMIQLNSKQADYYDNVAVAGAANSDKHIGRYANNRRANLITKVWSSLRFRQQNAVRSAGIEDAVDEMHGRWLERKRGGKFLEVGCFTGGRFTLRLMEAANRYVGVELSPTAVDQLRKRISGTAESNKSLLIAGDFLNADIGNGFDLVYAHGVLHHFKEPEPVFSKIASLCNRDAVLLFSDPSAVNPAYAGIRYLYRPFQSDAAWEWPFTRKTVAALTHHFRLVEAFGWGRWSLPLSVFAGLPVIGGAIGAKYRALVQREISRGINPWLWHNSFVAGVGQLN